ncbi:MAG: DNA topoisomerase VI subunit B [Nitrososphaeraceae archaeon]|nr:DNA topoisomerase VI subunit B [Nitrososphaeraceae archaeon]MDW0171915.1 DNA topoisomerase VI subunit B [Nitrososphaeraceae archaeon]MDW0172574.1 DNA topoisomerase VI subunit B [Nitrososphaeraceae archaeon]MDW0175041.1 DNA topoisomerase VI subunit B [Nitrososphaeraceae archaeon]MDW0177164.1 DNA topoisomerase VI subunit B [Nitrososphaeraceae archaeon]
MTSKVTTEVLEKGTKQPKTIMQINQKQKSKIHYNKKAESEFFVDNSALAGFTGERILYMSVRELIENSLDSCEVNHILPVIHLRLKILDPLNDLWTISCKDNGVGIPSEKVPVAVCSFLTSGKYVEKQQRGLFGVGLKMIAAFSTKDTDHPLKVWSKSEDESECYFDLRTDIGTNKPITLLKKNVKNDESQIEGEAGFKVEAILRAKLSPVTKNKIYDYISQTSIVNPYSIIIFETDEGKVTFKRRTEIMPNPSREVLPHPSDMDLKTLKKAILNFMNQKTTLQGILASSFQKMSTDKAKDIINRAGLSVKPADKYDEHELIKVVNICKHTKFQSPNTDHLSPIEEKILTVGMTSEYSIIQNKEATNSGSQTHLTTKILKPALTAYSSRICVVNNRPTVVECGIAYGGDIPSFKLYRFANKIPLLYDEGSDVAREVISEVGINKMGISKKEVKEQFSNVETKSDRTVEYLPIHIFFHICSTKIPYKTAGKESIASEGDLKKYMKSCLSDLYRKVSAQIRRELKIKEDENKLRLYKHYIPFIVDAISDSIKIDSKKLSKAFQDLAEKYVSGELANITKQIFQDSKVKGKVNDVDSKKNILNNGKGNEIILSKFDTRTNVSKHGSNVKLAKINAPRKSQKKG